MRPNAVSPLVEPDHDPVATFPVRSAVHPHPREHLPWSEEAILWVPGEPPLFGRRRIESRLAEDPALLPTALGSEVEFSSTEDHALEHGQGRWAGRAMRYCRVWRRNMVGDWRIAREVWNESTGLARVV